jgi:hypothetical protein
MLKDMRDSVLISDTSPSWTSDITKTSLRAATKKALARARLLLLYFMHLGRQDMHTMMLLLRVVL